MENTPPPVLHQPKKPGANRVNGHRRNKIVVIPTLLPSRAFSVVRECGTSRDKNCNSD